MHDKTLYLLAQFDNETQNILAGYYDILRQNGFEGNQTKNIPYHFTLGKYGSDCEKQLISKLMEVCSETACIDINLGHIGLFGLKVLFIGPNMNFELLKLHHGFFPDEGNGCHTWSAHATLLMDESETILKALPIIADNFKSVKARIESVGLYEFFPARLVRECRLR